MQHYLIAGSVALLSHLSAHLKWYAMFAHLNTSYEKRSVYLVFRWFLIAYIALKWDAQNANSDTTSIKSDNASIAQQY